MRPHVLMLLTMVTAAVVPVSAQTGCTVYTIEQSTTLSGTSSNGAFGCACIQAACRGTNDIAVSCAFGPASTPPNLVGFNPHSLPFLVPPSASGIVGGSFIQKVDSRTCQVCGCGPAATLSAAATCIAVP